MKFEIPKEIEYKQLIGKKYLSKHESNFKIQLVGYAYNREYDYSYYICKSLSICLVSNYVDIINILNNLGHKIEIFNKESDCTYKLCPCSKLNNSFIEL